MTWTLTELPNSNSWFNFREIETNSLMAIMVPNRKKILNRIKAGIQEPKATKNSNLSQLGYWRMR